MAKVYEFLANGFEEVEAMAPVDILRRGGVEVETVSVTASREVVSAHGVTVSADRHISDTDLSQSPLLILPGGMPGASNLLECQAVRKALLAQMAGGREIAAICAAPMVLGRLGLLQGLRATCYPGFERFLDGAEYTAEKVTRCANITTGRGPGAAMDFGFALLSLFKPEEDVERLKESMMYKE